MAASKALGGLGEFGSCWWIECLLSLQLLLSASQELPAKSFNFHTPESRYPEGSTFLEGHAGGALLKELP